MKINILTNNSAPNSRAFNCPLLVSKNSLNSKDFDLHFHSSVSKNLFLSDILFINSNFFRTYWKTAKNEIFSTLETASANKQKVIWFDTTDSTWCTQFEVLPYVDRFLKSHLLKEKKLYLKNYRTGRIFTDYFDELYRTSEKEENYPALPENEIDKLGLSWAPCYEQYNEKRYSLIKKISNYMGQFTSRLISGNFNVDFYATSSKRTNDISARFGLSHSRPSVVEHRKAVSAILEKRGVRCSRIPLQDYFQEMQNSKISLSPFGVGEFCYRDYETIICGAALVKPDMSHLETWPDLYQAEKTFIPHKWDLSDLEDKLDYLLNNSDYCEEIARNAQKVYKSALSDEGMEMFADRLVKIVNH